MLFFEECEGLSESIDLCYAMMNAPLFERPLFLFCDFEVHVSVGRCCPVVSLSSHIMAFWFSCFYGS